MRHDRSSQRSVGRTLWAFLQIVGHVLAPWRRPWRLRWGTAPGEYEMALPGDELLPDPTWGYTRVISIAASREQVWPWIAQLGQGRGGFYSFELLENAFGCRITNTDTILEEHQDPAVGDEIRLHPSSPPLHVVLVEPGRSLVLRGNPRDGQSGGPDSLWTFHLLPDGPGRSRLVERGRSVHGRSMADVLFFSPLLVEPIGFVMGRELLLGVRARAEHAAGTTPAPTWTPPRWLNSLMRAMLHTPGLQRLVGRSVALLTFTGRRTGMRYTTPLTYSRRGDTVTMITRRGRTWWRNLEENPEVELRLAGRSLAGRARAAVGDPSSLPDLVHFLEGHPRDAKAYGISVSDAGRVDRREAAAMLPQLVIVTVAVTAPGDGGSPAPD